MDSLTALYFFPNNQDMVSRDERERISTVRMARWLGVTPQAVREMPIQDYEDVKAVIMYETRQKSGS